MLTTLLKQIWTKRKSNGWLFVELFFVFIILWYVFDFLFTVLYTSHEYKGYDTNHVYNVSIQVNPNLREEYPGEAWTNSYLQIVRQVSEYPGVESACYYGGTIPYEEGTMTQSYTTDSLHTYRANIRMVSKDFFKVFRVELLEGSLENWDILSYPRPAIASRDLADSLFQGKPVVGQFFYDYYVPDKKYTLGGIVPRTKHTEYDRYEPFIYVPTEEWMLTQWSPLLSIRVNEAAEEGFIDRFTADMRNLAIGPFYFSQVKSYDEAKEIHDTTTNNYIRTALAVVSFFVFNIIISILGTFWFRTRKRRGEIGLRIALGASRATIFKELTAESALILLIATLPALIICFNIWFADVTVNVWMNPTLLRFIIGTGSTFLLMLLMVVAGVWYPANRAAKTEPAEALHEE